MLTYCGTVPSCLTSTGVRSLWKNTYKDEFSYNYYYLLEHKKSYGFYVTGRVDE